LSEDARVSKDGSRLGRSKRPSFETAAQEGGLLRMRLKDDVDMIRTPETLH
jgi:hypothetical protein